MPFQNYIYINPRISISNLSLLFLTIYIYITNKTSLKSIIHITRQPLPIPIISKLSFQLQHWIIEDETLSTPIGSVGIGSVRGFNGVSRTIKGKITEASWL